MLLAERLAWHEQAACRNAVNPGVFHPRSGEPTEPAKRICRMCLVRSECLESTLEYEAGLGETLRHGIYGGKSVKERNQILRCRSGRCGHPDRSLCSEVTPC